MVESSPRLRLTLSLFALRRRATEKFIIARALSRRGSTGYTLDLLCQRPIMAVGQWRRLLTGVRPTTTYVVHARCVDEVAESELESRRHKYSMPEGVSLDLLVYQRYQLS